MIDEHPTPADTSTLAAVAAWIEDAAPIRGLRPYHRAWLAEALRSGTWTTHQPRPAHYREAVVEARRWVVAEFGRDLTEGEGDELVAARRAAAQRAAAREERERRADERAVAALRRGGL